MATKKTTTPAPIAPFTIEQGALLYTFPATYVPDARRITFNDADYPQLAKGRDLLRSADALEQAADFSEAEPEQFPLPPGYTPARLREIAAQLRAMAKAQSDFEAAATDLKRLALLDRDVAANAISELLDTLKARSKRNASIKDRLNLLFNLHKTP